jgi:hypothetical protein
MLFDVVNDPGESKDIAAQHRDVVERMSAELERWRASCKASLAGEDYR